MLPRSSGSTGCAPVMAVSAFERWPSPDFSRSANKNGSAAAPNVMSSWYATCAVICELDDTYAVSRRQRSSNRATSWPVVSAADFVGTVDIDHLPCLTLAIIAGTAENKLSFAPPLLHPLQHPPRIL